MVDKKDELQKLAEEAAEEPDPERFKEIISELNKALEKEEKPKVLGR
jgi:hypothetical protein